MPTRDERLTTLQNAVTTYVDNEVARLRGVAAFQRSVFDGRSNGGRLSDAVTEQASSLLEDEINAFLVE